MTTARITSYLGGGVVAAIAGVFAALPLFGGAALTSESFGVPAAAAYGGAAAVWISLTLALYVWLSTEYVVEVDAEGITFFMQRRLGPFRGAPDVLVEARWAKAKRIYEHVETSRTRHGHEQKRYALRIDGARIDGGLLGTMDRSGKYLELLRAVRAVVGDRLETQGAI